MKDMIKLEHIFKSFNKRPVLRDVTLSIGQKETIALLGSNGSGKSTLLRIICGLLIPSSGEVNKKHGKDIRISYVPERFPKLRLTPKEYLLSMGRIQGMNIDSLNTRVVELIEQFGLIEASSARMNHFSKGMLQKVNIMQALLTQPDLIVLDEPLSGLDVESQQELRGVLQGLKRQNISMVLTSHESNLLEELVDRVICLEQGRLASNTVQVQKPYTVIHFKLLSDGVTFDMNSIGSIEKMEKFEGTYYIYVEHESSDEVLLKILKGGGSVVSVTSTRTTGLACQ